MSVKSLVYSVSNAVQKNSPIILTALGASGVLSTAYLASKASIQAFKIITEEEEKCYTIGADSLTKKEIVGLTWQLYIPAGVSAIASVACIIGATKIEAKRTAAAYSLIAMSEKAFGEYKDKIVEQLGKKKEEAIRDAIAQDKVSANTTPVIVAGNGAVLCYELHTGRYFNSDMETLRRAENLVNAKMLREMDASLNDFYYLVGLPNTSHSSSTGWTSDRMMELRFSTVLSDDNKPCIAFEYNYIKPIY